MGLKDVAREIATELYPSFQAGLNDAHAALKAFPDSMTPSSVLGQVGTPTPGEVDRALNGADLYGPDWREQYSPDEWAGYEQMMNEHAEPEITSADVDRMFERYAAEQPQFEMEIEIEMPELEPEL